MFICLVFQLNFFNLQGTYADDNNRTQKSKSYDDIFQWKMMQCGVWYILDLVSRKNRLVWFIM